MKPRPRRAASVLRWVGLLASTLALAPAAESATEAELLAPATTLERRLTAGESHVYRARLAPAARWMVRLDQLAVDVELEARWEGAEPLRVDNPLDRDGAELLLLPPDAARNVELTVKGLATAAGPGRYRLRLDAVDESGESGGTYLAALEAVTEAGRAYAEGGAEGRRRALGLHLRAVELWRVLRRPRMAARSLYAAAVLHRLLGEGPAALELAREVLPLWRALGDAGREADTWNEIGLLDSGAGRVTEGRAAFREALAVQERSGDLFRQAATANNLCLTHLMREEHRQALECYGQALERIRAAGDDENEAVALTNLGWVYKSLGQPEEALDHFRRAAALHRAAGRDKREAETLNNLAVLYLNLDEPQEALDLCLRALQVFREQGDRRWEGRVLHNLGTIYHTLGDPERAFVFYRQALAQRHELGDLAGEANTLKVLGRLELDDGRPREAYDTFRRALELERATEDARGEAVARTFAGLALATLGEHHDALESYAEALESLRALDDRQGQARALLLRGRSLLALERLDEATGSLSSALATFRSLGGGLDESEALFRLAECERAAGHAERALARVDEAIALAESLRIRVGDPDLRSTFASTRRGVYELRIDLLMELHQRLGHLAGESRHLRSALETSEQAHARGLVDLLQQTGVKASLEDASGPDTLTASQVQALLEPGTALVEYALGSDRSFLFLVTREAIRAFELPARRVLEEAARRAHEELSSPHRSDDETAGLARVLLPPAVAELAAERLVVVADGALHYLPFAALPVPAGAEGLAQPLLMRYEVVHLPSASVLAAQRRRDRQRRPAAHWAAVLADPVFDRFDPRLAGPAPSGEITTAERSGEAERQPQDLELPRLPTSRREAEAIAALAPPGEVLVALGFDAERSLVLSGRLADYRIVHFATHGVIDARYPALSGLALSLFDPAGRAREGFLRLRDVYSLRLRAEMVVLSACRTALGKEVRGEGLMGLTRGFLHAGARRVVASLWSVPDRATAELMSRFYRALAQDALPPAAALRRAQLSMLGERRWHDPHDWAGFVLIGDWR